MNAPDGHSLKIHSAGPRPVRGDVYGLRGVELPEGGDAARGQALLRRRRIATRAALNAPDLSTRWSIAARVLLHLACLVGSRRGRGTDTSLLRRHLHSSLAGPLAKSTHLQAAAGDLYGHPSVNEVRKDVLRPLEGLDWTRGALDLLRFIHPGPHDSTGSPSYDGQQLKQAYVAARAAAQAEERRGLRVKAVRVSGLRRAA